MDIQEANSLAPAAFIETFGGIYEHSAWVAEAVLASRPFATVAELTTAMAKAVVDAGPGPQLELLRAHPDLAGRLADTGELTAESTAEQKAAGLDDMSIETKTALVELNAAYLDRFGFPFVICARLNDADSILAAIRQRQDHSVETEMATALAEVDKIAELRLREILCLE